MIRKAKASDKEAIAELCYIIWEELEIDMVKQIERERLLKVMQKSIVDIQYRGNASSAKIASLTTPSFVSVSLSCVNRFSAFSSVTCTLPFKSNTI
jgi:hypothetical protein